MARTSSPARGTRLLAALVIFLAVLCVLTGGVLAKYISTAQDASATIGVTQWSSADAGQTFPVDVYVRAYVTKAATATDAAGNTVVDGTTSQDAPNAANPSLWKTLPSDPFCFYYVGTGGMVTGEHAVPKLELASGSEGCQVVYDYLEAGVTTSGKLTCQAAWKVTIGDGTVSAA